MAFRHGSSCSSTLLAGVALVCCAGAGASRAAEPIDFARDVVPVLTASGCSAGSCHGSFQGRGGFALSLLGFDPAADFEAVVLAARGRRVMPASPENSLLLLKATAAVAHGGGKRLSADSPAYRILRDYVAQGLKPPGREPLHVVSLKAEPQEAVLDVGEKASLRVTARWSDGALRDVTAWALYDSRDSSATDVSRDGVVAAIRPGRNSVSVRYAGRVASVAVTTPFAKAASFPAFPGKNYIDDLALAEWKRLGVLPASLSTDSEFVRRVHLDLIGTLPTPEEVKEFLADKAAGKRAKLIDRLLERPEYVDHWVLKWGDLLRVHRRYVGTKGLGSFNRWLRGAVRENRSPDKVVRELLTARGNLFSSGPVSYYFVDQTAEDLAETTAQLFLGIRLQCARCHHHPFEVWAQEDYYGLAAFFTRLEVRENGDKGRFGGMQAVRPVPRQTRKLPVAARPKLLGTSMAVKEDQEDIRVALADWITSKDNPFFARNFANRYWAYLVGRGLVEPIDDLRETNPATMPALLDALAKDFARHDFDVKHLLRTICNSRVYQLRSEIAPKRDRDGSLFTHRVPRRLGAEVLLDAVSQATGHAEAFDGVPPGTRAIALPDPTVASSFLTVFGRPQRNSPCECARDSSPDLLQALHLINSESVQARIAAPRGRLAGLFDRKLSDAAISEELYLAAYARRPTEQEQRTIRELLAKAPSRREGLEDLLWVLLNSPEFSFNH